MVGTCVVHLGVCFARVLLMEDDHKRICSIRAVPVSNGAWLSNRCMYQRTTKKEQHISFTASSLVTGEESLDFSIEVSRLNKPCQRIFAVLQLHTRRGERRGGCHKMRQCVHTITTLSRNKHANGDAEAWRIYGQDIAKTRVRTTNAQKKKKTVLWAII